MVKKKRKRKPSIRQRLAIAKVVENGGNVSKAMRDAGYSEATAKNPDKLTESKAFLELTAEYLPDEKILQRHAQQLNAHRLEHMVFPLGPDSTPDEDVEEEEDELPMPPSGETIDLSDEDIIKMLSELNCTVRKIVHGQQARHVYFWSADNKAQGNAIELAYKLKGHISNGAGSKIIVPVQVNVNEDRQKYA